jgi:hypothetical protein
MPPIFKNTRVLVGVAVILVLFISAGMWFASRGGSRFTGETKVETTVESDTVTYTDSETLVSESIANRIDKVEPGKLTFDGNVNVSSLPVGKPLLFPIKLFDASVK